MKKHFFLVALALCWLPSLIMAQAIEWQNTIGGNYAEYLYSIDKTSDGGFILGGFSDSDSSGDKTESAIGFYDYWLVKTDSTGNIQWQKTIGETGDENLYSVKQTGDGGYVLGGISNSWISGNQTYNYNYFVAKTDSTGNVQWLNSIGGYNTDYLYSLQHTSDGGYILGGTSYSNISDDKTENCIGGSDYWIIKLYPTGLIQWQNTIGGTGYENLRSILQTTDGGYLLGGYSNSDISGDKTENCIGAADYWIVKTDALGVIQWQNTIGGNSSDILNSIIQTIDGGYMLGGSSSSTISGDKTESSLIDDYWMVKLDAAGMIQWQNTIGGSGNDKLFSIRQTLDGGFILGGSSDSDISGDKTEDCNGNEDYWVIKADSLGTIQWQNTIGGDDEEVLHSVEQTNSGSYILGGYSYSNISGDKTENSNGFNDYWLIKINEQPTFIAENPEHIDNLVLYPNPAHSTLTIETELPTVDCQLIISDVTGRTLISKSITGSSKEHAIDISSFSKGIYFVQLQDGENISRGRFVKE